MSPLKDTDPAIIRMIVILATIAAGVAVSWMKTKRVGDKVERVGDQVGKKTDRAIELAMPTGNGFAKETKEALEAIRTLVVQSDRSANDRADRIEGKIDAHLLAHSNADINRSH